MTDDTVLLRYYVDDAGVILGAVCPLSDPLSVHEVPKPEDYRQVWQFPGWSEIPSTIPAFITRRQALRALLDTDTLDAVELYIADIDDAKERRAAQIEYETATWERSNLYIAAIFSAIGLSAAQIDELFILGATY